MNSSRRVENLARKALERARPKPKSLIVTIFGDAISPHGGSIWLGSIIRLMEAFDVNERIVRTSVFRLSKEHWLTANQVGRRSYYSVSGTGRHRFAAVEQRIYALSGRNWNKRWTVVFAAHAGIGTDARESLRRELSWLGFGTLVPGVMLHPDPDIAALRQTLIDAHVDNKTVVIQGPAEAWIGPEALGNVISRCWALDRLTADYSDFLETFRPLWHAMDAADALDPALCFLVRILLMHDYRRVLLRDPMLPDELLKTDWPGATARLLCRNLYRLVQVPAERYLMRVAETAEGPLPAAASFYFDRFGGLSESA